MSKQQKKRIPQFASEDEERTFWSDADATDYVDWSSAEGVTFPDLRPSLRSSGRTGTANGPLQRTAQKRRR